MKQLFIISLMALGLSACASSGDKECGEQARHSEKQQHWETMHYCDARPQSQQQQ